MSAPQHISKILQDWSKENPQLKSVQTEKRLKQILFRCEESVKDKLEHISSTLGMNQSEFLRLAVLEYDNWMDEIGQLQSKLSDTLKDKEKIEALEAQIQEITAIKSLDKLYGKCKGQELNGTKIYSKKDLINILAQNAIINQASEQEPSTAAITTNPIQAKKVATITPAPTFMDRYGMAILGCIVAAIVVVFIWVKNSGKKVRNISLSGMDSNDSYPNSYTSAYNRRMATI